ncbi:MAG: SRPBCC family protein [Miltoncostaeaceae bacterium]
MANHFHVEIDVDAPARRVWEVVGDPAEASWFPAVESCRLEGDIRYADMVGGYQLRERITHHDDEGMSYTYSVLSGTPTKLRSHSATIGVEESGSGSRVVWRTEAEPEDPDVDLEARLGAVMQKGLAEVKRRSEAGS